MGWELLTGWRVTETTGTQTPGQRPGPPWPLRDLRMLSGPKAATAHPEPGIPTQTQLLGEVAGGFRVHRGSLPWCPLWSSRSWGVNQTPSRLRAWPACISQGRCYVWGRFFFFKEKPLSGLRVSENLIKAREPAPSQDAPVHTLREPSQTWPAGTSERPETRCALAEVPEHLSLPPVEDPERRRAGPRAPKPAPFTPPACPGECHPHPTPSSLLSGNVFCSKNGFSDPASVAEPTLPVPRCLRLPLPPGPREVPLSRGDPKAGQVEPHSIPGPC